MKKLLSLTLTLAMLISAVSCNETAEKKSEPKKSYTAEKMSVAAYKKEALPLPENMQMVYTIMPYNNGKDFLMLGTSTRTPEIWKVNGDFSESEIIEYPEFDVGVNYNLTATNDGTIVLFVCHADYGDLPPIPLYEYPNEEEMKKYDEVAEYSFMIKTYSPDGKLKSEVTVEDFGVVPDKSVNFKNLYSDGEIVIAEINGGFEMFDINGKYLGEFKTDKGEVDCFGQDNQGNLICALKNEVDEKEILTFCKVEKDGKLTELNNTEYNFDETVYEMQATSGEYSLLLRTNSQLYGVKSDTQEIVSLFDISTSGYSTNYIEGYSVMPDGNIALMLNNSKEWKVELKKFIPRTEEEMANLKTITLGIEGDGMFIEEYVNEWNDGGNDFLVEVVKYSADYEDRDAVFDQLQQDAISGNLPDMMCFEYDYGVMNNVDFVSMGVLEDLYTFMDKDDLFTRDYFMPSVLSYFENDGELPVIPNRVALISFEVAKTKFVGDGSDWNLDKKVEMLVNPPIEREITNDSKYTRMSLGVWFGDWIDETDGSCHFTDDSFIRYLNFCNEADVIEIEYVEKTEAEWQEYLNSDERYDEMRSDALKYIEDRDIIYTGGISRYGNYTEIAEGTFGGEQITVLGDITFDGFHQLGITKTSENKELAWEFIKSCLTDQYYMDNINSGPFPVTKSGYKLYNDNEIKSCNSQTYSGFPTEDLNKFLEGYEGLIYHITPYDEVLKIGKITDEHAKAVDTLFNKATRKDKILSAGIDTKMHEIYYEEIEKFFNGGYTAEKCAEVLQDRISTYISEQFT
ncbi:MAG: hypothetical protein IJN43_02350 [Ruminococcus sp.]|nr:hypothetical protein [Ruminococcus sp.]